MGGIKSKFKTIRAALELSSYDVVVITETWFDDSVVTTELFNSNWSVFRCDRNSKTSVKTGGGGVLIAVKNNWRTVQLYPAIECIEQVWVQIELTHSVSKYLTVGAVYLPPGSPKEKYEAFAEYMEPLVSLEESNTVVLGDFNLPNLRWSPDEWNELVFHPINVSSEKEELITDKFSVLGMSQMCDVKVDNQLDLIFSTLTDDCLVYEACHQLQSKDDHHCPIQVSLLVHGQRENLPLVQSYDFNRADVCGLRNTLALTNWCNVLGDVDIDSMANGFNEYLNSLFHQFVPLRAFKSNKCPWFNSDLANLRNRRNKSHKIYVRHPSESNWRAFISLREEFSSLNDYLYDLYVQKYSERFKSHPKSFWRFVNEKREAKGLPPVMHLEGVSGRSPMEIAELFANQFQSVYSSAARDVQFDIGLGDEPKVEFVHLERDEILKGLLALNPYKGAGPDMIPNSFLKSYADLICDPITKLFERSLRDGKVAGCWKTSYINPIFKSGDRSVISNYRGIACLNSIPKLLEKLITANLTPIISPCLHQSQHGFLSGRSTMTNLVSFTDFVLSNMRRRKDSKGKFVGGQIDAIYTDFAKAFDRVEHRILVKKLHAFGIQGNILNWLESYLANRNQMVKVNDATSQSIHVTSGVPQGSHLGPLLFCVFIDDLLNELDDSVAFADDIKVFRVINDSNDTLMLQQELDKVVKWCAANRMELNVSKCEVITFSRRNKDNQIHFNYQINATELRRVQLVRDLGIWLDDKCDMNAQVNQVVSKAKLILGFVKRQSREFRCPYVTKSLYCALVRSILEYCSVVWDPWTDVANTRLESVQKQFLKFALRDLPWSHAFIRPPYMDRLNLLHLQSLKGRRNMAAVLLIFDILEGKITVEKLANEVKFKICTITTRLQASGARLEVPQTRTEYESNRTMVRACDLFNQVIDCYNPAVSRDTFKRLVMTKSDFK